MGSTEAGGKTLLFIGMAGQAAFAATVVAEDLTRPNFQPWRRWVSHLSLGKGGWVNTVGLAVAGTTALAGAAGLRRSGIGNRVLPAAVGTYGGALILAAVFPIDPGLGWPEGVKAVRTPKGAVHQVAGGLTFAGLTTAAFAGRRWFRGQSHPAAAGLAKLASATGVVVPVAFVVCGGLAGMDVSGKWHNAPSGLFERIALLSGMGWLTRLFGAAARAGG
jgi:hypothetical protein